MTSTGIPAEGMHGLLEFKNESMNEFNEVRTFIGEGVPYPLVALKVLQLYDISAFCRHDTASWMYFTVVQGTVAVNFFGGSKESMGRVSVFYLSHLSSQPLYFPFCEFAENALGIEPEKLLRIVQKFAPKP